MIFLATAMIAYEDNYLDLDLILEEICLYRLQEPDPDEDEKEIPEDLRISWFLRRYERSEKSAEKG